MVGAEKYDRAVAAFHCSILMVEHQDTLFNAAQAAKLSGDNEAALRFAERCLTLDPDGEVATEVEQMIAALKKEVATSAALTKPSENAQSSEPSGRAEPKRTENASEPSGRAEPKRTEDAIAAPSGPSKPATDPPANIAALPEKSDLGPLTIVGYVAVSAGGAALVVGAVLQGVSSKAWSDGKSTDNYGEFREYKDKMEGMQTGALVGFIAGGMVAVAGTVLILVNRKEKKEKVRLSATPAGFTLSGRF